nr:uncharacterized protein LOC128706540 [Cherax quadricarinatus]
MVVLRRKLIKAKHSGKESKYQLRVEDVAHITNLDETSNTYVNTTDLQKLVATVRAKGKSTERVPTPPRMVHQTPTPYKPPLGPHSSVHPTQGEKNSFLGEGDVVLVKAPMPLPYSSLTTNTCSIPTREQPKQDVIYCNLQETQPAPHLSPLTNTTTTPPRSKVEAPRIAPPPPPAKMNSVPLLNYQDDRSNSGPVSPTIIARPAPAPPAVAKSQRNDAIPTPSPTQKPTPPPVSHKPSKGPRVETISPTQAPAPVKPTVPKPMPPTLPKPGVSKKGKDLPPLKMAPFPFIKSWKQHVSTPDTSIIELTPDSTPTTESVGSGSISAKIAFLEGKMKTPSRATGPRT